ncbi:MAG TPA: hypothetical protein VL443_25610 [Cyclobacteriaceae bacterium]|jgi:hypothetical protein|nr:hypothetical protein [Cyclobacteriaceae bacterium]
MVAWDDYNRMSLDKRISLLYQEGKFVMNIRYYGYKVNLYLLNNFYLEVFVNHKLAAIEKIQLLDTSHSRMKFYSDQIKLPQELLVQS